MSTLQSWPAWLQNQTFAITSLYTTIHSRTAVRVSTGQTTPVVICLSVLKTSSRFIFCITPLSTAVLSVWNSLEPYLGSAASFKSRLKTLLFSAAYRLVLNMIHCQAAPPIRMQSWALYKFALYSIVLRMRGRVPNIYLGYAHCEIPLSI